MKLENMTNIDYEKLLELEPQNIGYMRQYAIFLLKTKNYIKAQEQLLKIIDIDPNDITAHTNYALLLTYKIKDYEKAEVHYLKALEIDANNVSANKNYKDFLKYRTVKSKYYQKIMQLSPLVKGKTVEKSIVGNAGFILIFTDNTSIVNYIKKEKLYYKYIEIALSEEDIALTKSDDYGDGFGALNIDIPYADKICDLASEISNAHSETITGFSIGEDSFNFCFPNGMELETMLITDKDNKIIFRVFWEQW